MRVYLITIIFCSVFLFSCSEPFSKTTEIKDSSFNGTVNIQKNDKIGRYCLSIHNRKSGRSDKIYTPYQVFEMKTGDVNGDGRTDICLGIIKPTPFDSVLKKRLFIFQIDHDYIRPLWLSSRLVRPFESFTIIGKGAKVNVLAIEKERKSRFCVSEYSWGSFGMYLVEKHVSDLTLSQARKFIKEHN